MSMLSDWEVSNLRAKGYQVFLPGERLPIEVRIETRDVSVEPTLEQAAALLKEHGWLVQAPKPPPAEGSVWTPTRGKSLARRVVAPYAAAVTYWTDPEGPMPHRITLRSWQRWVTEARAKVAW